jgi:hypothetical protein
MSHLIHEDFALFSLDKTMDEIYDLYLRSMVFVEGLGDCFRECEDADPGPPVLSRVPHESHVGSVKEAIRCIHIRPR